MKTRLFVSLMMALMVATSLLGNPLSAHADYYYDHHGHRSILSDILHAPILGGHGNSWQYNPYASGYHDGYRNGTRYDSWRYRHDRDDYWWSAYPPGYYHGQGKKLGHYKHYYR